MSDSGEGPRRSPSGQLRALGVTLDSLNNAQRDVFDYVMAVIDRRRQLYRTLHGDVPYVVNDRESAAIAEEIRGRQLRDLISTTFMRFTADIEKSKAPSAPDPDATPPASPLARRKTQP